MSIPIYRGALPSNFFDRRPSAELDLSHVATVLGDVKQRGDAAVAEANLKFDKDRLEPFALSAAEISAAIGRVPTPVLDALKLAHRRIRSFAQTQRAAVTDSEWTLDGVTCGTRFVPVSRAACYVPGGRFPLPSSALMTVTAAKVAGVPEVFVFSPRVADATVAAAQMAGADRIFRIGGPQAIAAAAYGTASIPKVDLIAGPGNAYVTEAKRLLVGQVGIDMIAGPSEVLVIADDSANPEWIAADLLAQAEHDPTALPVLLTPSAALAERVATAVTAIVKRLPLPPFIAQSLSQGALAVLPDLAACVAVSERVAPEHLEVQVADPAAWLGRLSRYGALFVGGASAEVFGDYLAGTNHVLPTGGAARFSSGLSPLTFLMARTWQSSTSKAAAALAPAVEILAHAEGLNAHAEAARLRRG